MTFPDPDLEKTFTRILVERRCQDSSRKEQKEELSFLFSLLTKSTLTYFYQSRTFTFNFKLFKLFVFVKNGTMELESVWVSGTEQYGQKDFWGRVSR